MHNFFMVTLPSLIGATVAVWTMILTYMNINPLDLF